MSVMNHSMPLVSIGLPVYNGERFLDQTLACLLGQTLTDFEIVISDNASTDATADICQKYAAADARIRYVRNARNIGAARNLMKVVELSAGRYFKLANADDLCEPVLIAECVAILERHPEAVLAYGRTSLIDERGCVTRRYDDGLHLPTEAVAARFRRAIGRVRLINVIQGVMRTEAARQVFAGHGSYEGADQVLVAALTLYGQVHEIPAYLFFRRMHAGASSAIKGHAGLQSFLDPDAPHVLPLYLCRQYVGHFKAITRAPLPYGQKLRVLNTLAAAALGCRETFASELTGAAGLVLKSLGRRTANVMRIV